MKANKDKIIVLMYHDVYAINPSESGIDSPDCSTYKIQKDIFESHLRAIKHLIDSKIIPRNNIHFTFDDGGVSFYTIIMPLLEKYGFIGKFFIASSFIDSKGFLSKEMIVEMSQRGHIIGAHSHSHRQRMHTLPLEEIITDWQLSLNILNKIISGNIKSASLPNGYKSTNIVNSIIQNGITEIYTSNPTDTPQKHDNYIEFGRYAIRNGMTDKDIIELITNSALRRRLYLKFKVLSLVKKIFGSYYLKLREKLLK